MTPSARALLFGLALLPLACPLLLDDDFVFEDKAMSGRAEGGASGTTAGAGGEAGTSDCDVENWSGRGAVPHACRDKD